MFCKQGIVLEVQKSLERTIVGGRPQVRGLKYRYVAWIPRASSYFGVPVLRYHNLHERDEDFHHRVFSPQTGEQILYETLERSQFPVMSEILDEIEAILKFYPIESADHPDFPPKCQ